MGREYGPWVRHDWCPSCYKRTEQTRWHLRLIDHPHAADEHRVRCNECATEMPVAN
ncbi:hypothetical protein GCM10025786_36140 [Nocardioides caeni]